MAGSARATTIKRWLRLATSHFVMSLDYLAAKLDIKLILEAVDGATIAAAQALDLPGSVEIVVAPELFPRIKPKALNYALPLARGDYLVIYDAEDRPEPDQLRKAVAAFREGPPNLACVQARLNLYNRFDSWLTRQFAIEYGALFDGILPALDRLELPIPLGGTSIISAFRHSNG
jgi:cellulose synthase/poly-beta-1,6-N-acetylglucosamine synthase-like glycosyltransferase